MRMVKRCEAVSLRRDSRFQKGKKTDEIAVIRDVATQFGWNGSWDEDMVDRSFSDVTMSLTDVKGGR